MAAVGREPCQLDDEHLSFLYNTGGLTRKQLAKTFSVSERTISSRLLRCRARKQDVVSQISDNELDEIISEAVISSRRKWGEKMIAGHVQSIGFNIPRSRIRASLHRVDAEGIERRKATTLKRRVYTVQGPNALWHMDGNHKLIRWRFVVHGAVDGYTRIPVFLECSANNKAATVLKGFLGAINNYGIPGKVRTDMGLENVLVAKYMISNHGENAFITGRSVHNQRIERHWKDVFEKCTGTFSELFHSLEENGQLDPLNEVHIFALHYVFLPIINFQLEQFREAHCNHRIRTEGNKTPIQLWTQSVEDGYEIQEPTDEDLTFEGNEMENAMTTVNVPDVMDLSEAHQADLLYHFPMDGVIKMKSVDHIAYYEGVCSYIESLNI